MKIKGYLKPIILKLLRGEEKTGSELVEEISNKLGVEPSYGSIYPLLGNLKEKELVEMEKIGREKRYQLTEEGEKAADKIEERRREIVESVLQSLRTLKTIFDDEELDPIIENVKRRKEEEQVPRFPQLLKMHELLVSEDWRGKENRVKEELDRTFERLKEIIED